jgi:hypothetical protein
MSIKGAIKRTFKTKYCGFWKAPKVRNLLLFGLAGAIPVTITKPIVESRSVQQFPNAQEHLTTPIFSMIPDYSENGILPHQSID